MHHKGKVVSRTELIEHIYDQDFDRDSNTIEVFVTRIRKKLGPDVITTIRSEEHTSELQSLMRISYAVFCLKKKTIIKYNHYKNVSCTTESTRHQSYLHRV